MSQYFDDKKGKKPVGQPGSSSVNVSSAQLMLDLEAVYGDGDGNDGNDGHGLSGKEAAEVPPDYKTAAKDSTNPQASLAPNEYPDQKHKDPSVFRKGADIIQAFFAKDEALPGYGELFPRTKEQKYMDGFRDRMFNEYGASKVVVIPKTPYASFVSASGQETREELLDPAITALRRLREHKQVAQSDQEEVVLLVKEALKCDIVKSETRNQTEPFIICLQRRANNVGFIFRRTDGITRGCEVHPGETLHEFRLLAVPNKMKPGQIKYRFPIWYSAVCKPPCGTKNCLSVRHADCPPAVPCTSEEEPLLITSYFLSKDENGDPKCAALNWLDETRQYEIQRLAAYAFRKSTQVIDICKEKTVLRRMKEHISGGSFNGESSKQL